MARTDEQLRDRPERPRGFRRRSRSVVLPRRLRRGLRLPPRRQADPRDHRPRPGRPRPARAPRRDRRRRVHRRRRGDHDRPPPRVPADAGDGDRLPPRGAPAPGPPRGCDVLPRPRSGRRLRDGADAHHRARLRRRPHPDRLARRARRRDRLRRAGPRVGAAGPPALHRRRRGLRRRRRVRAQPLRRSPPRRARAGAEGLVPELLLPDPRLQGDADGAAAAAVLPRPARHVAREPLRDRPLALLDQHGSQLGARPAAADDRPQRRDQHGARQLQLDARPRGGALLRGARRRPPGLPAADRRGLLRLRRLRPRARADRARRPHRSPRDDDDDPGRLGGRRRRAPRLARGLLPLPRPAHGAVGRSRRDRVLRRQAAGSDARPQRPAPGSLDDHPRRLGLPRLGVGDLHRRPREGRAHGPAPSRGALRRRSRDRPGPHRRRGREGRLGGRPLRRVARGGQARRPPAPRPDEHDRPGRAAPAAPARVRLHAGGHPGPARAAAPRRPRADRLDGQRPLARGLLRLPPLALLLLQAALRAGDEPGDRLRARAERDEPAHRHRSAGEPPVDGAAGRQPRRARAADPHRLRARAAAAQPLRRAAPDDDRHHVLAREGRGRARGGARPDPPSGDRGARGGHDAARPQRPGDRSRPGADSLAPGLLDRPSLAGPRGDAPAGGPGRRVG